MIFTLHIHCGQVLEELEEAKTEETKKEEEYVQAVTDVALLPGDQDQFVYPSRLLKRVLSRVSLRVSFRVVFRFSFRVFKEALRFFLGFVYDCDATTTIITNTNLMFGGLQEGGSSSCSLGIDVLMYSRARKELVLTKNIVVFSPKLRPRLSYIDIGQKGLRCDAMRGAELGAGDPKGQQVSAAPPRANRGAPGDA